MSYVVFQGDASETPSHAVGIWAERFEQRADPVDLALGEQRWEIWFFCKFCPEKWPWQLAILKASGSMKCAAPSMGIW
jgi:hypothetical protein